MHTDRSPLLSGRALVTGGTSGIGLAFAKALATRGCDLVLVARNPERLESTRAEFEASGTACETLVADLNSDDGIAAVRARLESADSPVEILINNAGAGLSHPLATRDTGPLRDAVKLMGIAPMEIGAVAAAVMSERGSGVIVNTSSVNGLVPMGAYSAVKAFVKVWSESLALEVAPAGVHVTTFVPGWTRTEFHARSGKSTKGIPDFLWLDADDAVAACLADVERGRTLSVPSKRYKVISMLANKGPRGIVNKVANKITRGRSK